MSNNVMSITLKCVIIIIVYYIIIVNSILYYIAIKVNY